MPSLNFNFDRVQFSTDPWLQGFHVGLLFPRY